MGEFHISLGAKMDVVTPEEMNDAITGLQGHIDRKFSNQPRMTIRTLTASTFQSFNGGTFQMVLEPQKPAAGKLWIVRRLTITGADDNTTVPNLKAAFYVGDPFNFTLGQLIQPAQAIPSVNYYSNKSVYVYDKEVVFINFVSSGALNFQGLQASMMVEEWDVESFVRMRE